MTTPTRITSVVVLAFSADPAPAVQRREHTVAVVDPATRALTLTQDWTWTTLPEAVGPRLRPGTLWAVDFPLSFPAGFVAQETGAAETWAAALEWADVHGELTLAVGRPPFWGRNRVPRPKKDALPRYGLTGVNRATERSYPPAKSVFQVAGPDAVGTAALRGMAWLRRSGLRDRCHAWPFDGPAPDAARPLLIEVLPRAFWPDMRIEDPTARAARLTALQAAGYHADAAAWAAAARPFGFRAVTAACGLTDLLAVQPALLTDPACPAVTDPQLRYEGWALGPAGGPPAERGRPAGGAGGGS